MTIGIVPAAGLGERFPLTFPKELYPVVRKGKYERIVPLIGNTLENMVEAGINEAYVTINPHKTQLMEYFHKYPIKDLIIHYVMQSEAKGLVNAIRLAHHLIPEDNDYLMALPDTIYEDKNLYKRMIESKDELNLGVFKRPDSNKFSLVSLDGEKVLTLYHKETRAIETFWGCWYYNKDFRTHLDLIVDTQEARTYHETSVILDFMKKGYQVKATLSNSMYYDLGTPEGILKYENRRSCCKG